MVWRWSRERQRPTCAKTALARVRHRIWKLYSIKFSKRDKNLIPYPQTLQDDRHSSYALSRASSSSIFSWAWPQYLLMHWPIHCCSWLVTFLFSIVQPSLWKNSRNWNINGFVKSQFLLAQWPFGGVSSDDAKFQELVASSSNSLKFLTHNHLKRWIPKWSNIACKRLFTNASTLFFKNLIIFQMACNIKGKEN